MKLAWVALAGYTAFAAAFYMEWTQPEAWNRMDLAALTQQAAVAAREIAGVDVTGWVQITTPAMDQRLAAWQRRFAKGPIDRLVPPLYVTVRFQKPPARPDAVEVRISPGGAVRSVRVFGPPHTRPEITESEKQALAAMARLAGPLADKFEREDTRMRKGEDQFRWRAQASESQFSWRIDVQHAAGRFSSASIEPVFRGPGRGDFFHGAFYEITRSVLTAIPAVWAFLLCAYGWARKVLDWTLAWKAGAAFAIFAMLRRLSTGEDAAALVVLGFGGMAIVMAAITGAGRLAASASEWPRWQAFVLFCNGRWNGRAVGDAVLSGMAWAGAAAAIPFALAAVFPRTSLDIVATGAPALARWPFLAGMTPLIERPLYGLFVFVAAVLMRKRTLQRWGYWFLAAVSAVGVFFVANPFASGIPAAVASAALTGVLFAGVYWMHGLLSVLVAIKVASLLPVFAAFLRSSPPLVLPALLIGAALAAAAVFAWRTSREGLNLEVTDDRDPSRAFLSERERLKAEFSLAQQAQQRMLPATPPRVDGFALAAACLPARDVGGDLYDYFALPDGRLGICVADVSGKGMPAALYMTLTKGVLAAASTESAHLLDLSRHLNRHLYAAGKRRIFVTAVLAALDAERREVEFVRAGHNPVLLHSRGEARYLEARGMGLGMTGGVVFERATNVERVALEPGDTLLLYSDGVTEAMNADLEQYGEDRLRDVLMRAASLDAQALLEEIRRDIAAFTAGEPAHDDITIVVLQSTSS